MMNKPRKIMIKVLSSYKGRTSMAKEAIENSGDEWWDSQTPEFQEAYIEEHPGSKYAKNAKKREEKSPSAKEHKEKPEGSTKKLKEKKDPYADVPEVDKVVMVKAKERGFTVPPAWREVWLNEDPEGDLQVKGKDKKNRTQYLYSLNYRTQQNALKFERLKVFTQEYPEMVGRINKDKATSEEAKVLYLISKTGFRIGSDTDTGAEKKAYGASTLTGDHIKIEGSTVHFDFIGKEGVHQKHSVEDAELAEMLKGAKPGQKLFKTKPAKIHKYLDGISEEHFKVKDFRTYVGTSTALSVVRDIGTKPTTKKEYDRAVMDVCKIVAAKLGNTPVMARDSYIDPTVFMAWQEGIDMTVPEKKKKETSSGKPIRSDEDQLMIDFIETHHFQVPEPLLKLYRAAKALPAGSPERMTAYQQFQKLAKGMKVVNTKSKEEYIKSLKVLENLLSKKK
jgi:DNA topoisomerase-1